MQCSNFPLDIKDVIDPLYGFCVNSYQTYPRYFNIDTYCYDVDKIPTMNHQSLWELSENDIHNPYYPSKKNKMFISPLLFQYGKGFISYRG